MQQNLLCLLYLSNTQKFQTVEYPKGIIKKAKSNFGVGRGKIKSKRRKFEIINHYEMKLNNSSLFYDLTHLSILEFEDIFIQLNFTSTIKATSQKNQMFIAFWWMVHYPEYSELEASFIISKSSLSDLLNEFIQKLMELFVLFIPNQRITDSHSIISTFLSYVVDGTIHKHVRRYKQWLFYRKDKGCHFSQTFLLLDYEKWIVAFYTNVHGHLTDNTPMKNCHLFKRICEESNSLAISDSGFKNVDFICAGYKSNEVNTENKLISDIITRKEQKKIEHVNSWIKTWKTLGGKFEHRQEWLAAIVCIKCGLYNYKKSKGHFQ